MKEERVLLYLGNSGSLGEDCPEEEQMKKIGLLKAMYLCHKADKMTDEQRMEMQQLRLQELVSYAREYSPYYAKLYENVGENAPLSELPITNKLDMMEHFDCWMTDRSITKERVEHFTSDLSNVGKKMDGKYLIYTTSGSTGNPCTVLYDETAMNVSFATGVLRGFARKKDAQKLIRQKEKSMILFAEGGFYLASGAARYNLQQMPWRKRSMQVYDVRNKTGDIVAELNRCQPSMIASYPTALELLAYEKEKGNLSVNPSVIMTGGEKLNEDVRKRLSDVFQCDVHTLYACTEGGTVACECGENHFHVNDDWLIIEAVDENDQPVPYGTQSAKILLTNLANKVCPLIRFEITDRVVMHNEPCGCGNPRPWLTIEGRTDDILTFENGDKMSPLPLYVLLKEVHGIQRFQLIQVMENTLELRIEAKDRGKAFADAKAALEKYLSHNGIFCEILLSDKLPQANAKSGKFKHIVAMKREEMA